MNLVVKDAGKVVDQRLLREFSSKILKSGKRINTSKLFKAYNIIGYKLKFKQLIITAKFSIYKTSQDLVIKNIKDSYKNEQLYRRKALNNDLISCGIIQGQQADFSMVFFPIILNKFLRQSLNAQLE